MHTYEGFDFEHKDRDGSPYLFLAAEKCSPDMSQLLIDFGANVNATNDGGENALHFAAKNMFTQKEEIDFLVNHGLDINGKDNRGWTPLHHAVYHGAYVRDIKYLVEHGADPHPENPGTLSVSYLLERRLLTDYQPEHARSIISYLDQFPL